AGSATDGAGAALPASSLSWMVWKFHINHVHPIGNPTTGASDQFIADAPEDFSAINGGSRLLICLSVTDTHGIKTTIEQDFNPHLVKLTWHTDPVGGKIALTEDDVDHGVVTDGQTVTSWDGYQLDVSANDQTIGGQAMTFSSWSDGGAKSHVITTPSSDSTFTATFKKGSGGGGAKSYEAEAGTLAGGAV